MFRRIATVFTLIAACTAFASASSIDMSASASLESLLGGGSLSIGSITIDNFANIETANAGSGTVTPVDPSTVGVTAEICDGELELTFGDASGGLGGFVASASDGGTYDYLVSFDISGTSGISNASLTQLAGGAGPSFANITETILFPGGAAGLNTDEGTPFDSAALGGNPGSISVAKDILLQSFAGSSAQISQFSQTYSLVPEPSAIGLGFLGMIGALGRSRRRRRQS